MIFTVYLSGFKKKSGFGFLSFIIKCFKNFGVCDFALL